MPQIKGKPKKLINYKIPQDLEIKVDRAIEAGNFSSQADLITAALHFYFNNQDLKNQIAAFLESDEGKRHILMALESRDDQK